MILVERLVAARAPVMCPPIALSLIFVEYIIGEAVEPILMSSNSTELSWLSGTGETMSESLLKNIYHSVSHLRADILLIVYYLLQFTQVFVGSVLYKGLTVLFCAAARPVLRYLPSFNKDTLGSPDGSPIQTSPSDLEKEEFANPVSQLGPAILTAEEDKKSSRASDRDISVLYRKGYNRYRYVSKSFIKRNKLNKAVDEEDDADDNNSQVE